MKKPFSLHRYLKLLVLLWVLVLSLLTTVWIYFDAKHEVDELFDSSLVQSARVLDGLLHLHPLDEEITELEKLSNQINQRTHRNQGQVGHPYEKKVSFQIWNDTEGLILKSESAPEKRLAKPREGFHRVQINNHGWRTFALYSKQNKWWLLVAEDDEIREELSHYIVRDHIFPLIIGIPFLLLILHYLIIKGLLPLSVVARQLKERNHRDLKPINDKDTPEEILGLVQSLNQLFSRLQAAYERESRFTADAAHELRNPLAALMIHTENALEDTVAFQRLSEYKNSTEVQKYCDQQHQDLENLYASTSRLAHSVKQLLALSRAENHAIEEDHTWFNLYTLCHDIKKQQQLGLIEKQQQLTIDIDSDYKIFAYQTLLTILINNLLSNAINYCPPNSKIHLHCYNDSVTNREGEQFIFVCEDSGKGISKSERKRVQDRFYRLPNNSKAYGSGLGLSIVDAIVKKHDGAWHLDESKLGGLKVVVYLPNTVSQSDAISKIAE